MNRRSAVTTLALILATLVLGYHALGFGGSAATPTAAVAVPLGTRPSTDRTPHTPIAPAALRSEPPAVRSELVPGVGRTAQPAPCSASVTATRGKFGDEYDTGNIADDPASDLKSLAVNSSFHAFFSKEAGGTDHTRLERASGDKASPQCYYRVTNFCIKDGTLVFIRPPTSDRSSTPWENVAVSGSTGTLRLCNELRSKVNLKFFIESRFPADGLPILPTTRWAHVTACWQYYGYHLAQCVATAFATEAMHGAVSPADTSSRAVDMWLYNHAISLPQVSREHYSHAMYMGGAGGWNDTAPRAKKYRSAPWWPMWSQSTVDADRVNELFKFPVPPAATGKSVCYRRGLIGHPNHNFVPGDQRRAHRLHLDALFLTPGTRAENTQAASDGTIRVLVTQRGKGKNQGGRHMLNLDAVVSGVATAFTQLDVQGVRKVTVDVVDWAEMSYADQYNRAATADVVVAMHGAGNSWILAQRPRTAFIEIWPQCVARNVYLVMARQYNVRYYSLCLQLPSKAPAGSPEARYGFLHHSLDVPLPRLLSVVRTAIEYVGAVRRGQSCASRRLDAPPGL